MYHWNCSYFPHVELYIQCSIVVVTNGHNFSNPSMWPPAQSSARCISTNDPRRLCGSIAVHAAFGGAYFYAYTTDTNTLFNFTSVFFLPIFFRSCIKCVIHKSSFPYAHRHIGNRFRCRRTVIFAPTKRRTGSYMCTVTLAFANDFLNGSDTGGSMSTSAHIYVWNELRTQQIITHLPFTDLIFHNLRIRCSLLHFYQGQPTTECGDFLNPFFSGWHTIRALIYISLEYKIYRSIKLALQPILHPCARSNCYQSMPFSIQIPN